MWIPSIPDVKDICRKILVSSEGSSFELMVRMIDCRLPSVSSSTLERYVHAVKGSDEIHMFLFTTVDVASNEAEFMDMNGLLSGQNNQVVYFATKQARKDSKL